MNWAAVIAGIETALAAAPQAISEAEAFWNAVKGAVPASPPAAEHENRATAAFTKARAA